MHFSVRSHYPCRVVGVRRSTTICLTSGKKSDASRFHIYKIFLDPIIFIPNWKVRPRLFPKLWWGGRINSYMLYIMYPARVLVLMWLFTWMYQIQLPLSIHYFVVTSLNQRCFFKLFSILPYIGIFRLFLRSRKSAVDLSLSEARQLCVWTEGHCRVVSVVELSVSLR